MRWDRILTGIATESAKVLFNEVKKRYPILSNDSLCLCDKCKKSKDNSSKKKKYSEGISKLFMSKYNKAIEQKNLKEEEIKRLKMSSLRNTVIGTTLGFTAGAAASYFLIKKSQIKESDYVFNDQASTVEKINYEEPEVQQNAPVQEPVLAPAQQKNFRELNENYQISDDGTTLIKKKI